MLELRDGTRKKWQALLTLTDLHKTNTKWLVHSWSTFGARTSHVQLGHKRLTTARTWRKPPPSPLWYTLCFSTGATSKWLYVPGLPSGSFEIVTTRSPATLRAHNFMCRPLIAMRSKEKLYPSLRAFQRYVARCLQATKSGRFPTFSGRESNCQTAKWESNWQFDSRPFFWP